MKKICLFLLCCNLLMGTEIPKNIKNEIFKEAIVRSSVSTRRDYIQDQERAYQRMVVLKDKVKMSNEEFDEKLNYLKKRYGNDYIILYKYFVKEVEERQEKKVEIQKENLKKEKKNLEAKKVYEEVRINNKIPKDISNYINKTSQEKYGDDYIKRLEFQKNLEEFYFFLKK